jgi:hypothetical protein
MNTCDMSDVGQAEALADIPGIALFPETFRLVAFWFVMPRILRRCNKLALRHMDRPNADQAKEIYRKSHALLESMRAIQARRSDYSLTFRLLTSWPSRKLEAELECLGGIAETLARSADDTRSASGSKLTDYLR